MEGFFLMNWTIYDVMIDVAFDSSQQRKGNRNALEEFVRHDIALRPRILTGA